jgi:hypothetical protein
LRFVKNAGTGLATIQPDGKEECVRAISCVVFVLALMLPAPAQAQRRMPATGAGAVGGDFGVFLPQEDALESGLVLDGFYEYYFEPRTSLRLMVGYMNPEIDNGEDDSLRYVRIGGDVVYNWEGGAIHPFVGAGLGVYLLQFKDNGDSVGDSESKFGGNLFGGVEFFTSPTFAVKGEAKYHVVSDIDPGDFDPGGFSLTIGVKKYF